MTAHTKNESVFAIGRAGTVGYALGLTKRELFAAMVMQGLCANHGSYGAGNGPYDITVRALAIADALLVTLKDNPLTDEVTR